MKVIISSMPRAAQCGLTRYLGFLTVHVYHDMAHLKNIRHYNVRTMKEHIPFRLTCEKRMSELYCSSRGKL